MPDIIVEQQTFERLQRHARPLVDTTDMVINRALDVLEGHEAYLPDDLPITERRIDPQALPSLTHTKILEASLGGNRVTKPNWNSLTSTVLIRAMKQLADFDELRKTCPVQMVRGRKEDEGYHYLAEIDVSFQGLSANDACNALVFAAQNLRIELEIIVIWRLKEGAAHPGEKGRLNVRGTSSRSGAG